MPFSKPKPLNPKARERGAALIMLTLMLAIVVIPMVGLAIDGGIAYLIKTRLSAAVDAAALAGARSLSIGVDIASQTANAKATISDYLRANFPEGTFQTYNLTTSSTIEETAYKTRTVTVQANITFPLYFMKIIGQSNGQASAISQAARRDVNVILTLDRSGSMAGSPCTAMKAAAQSFSDKFTNGRDRLALITFKASAHVDYEPTLQFKTQSPSIRDTIGQINCSGSTGSAQALTEAYGLIKQINEPGALNLVVFFTDGLPNGVAAKFLMKQEADTRYDTNATSNLVVTNPTTCIDNAEHALTGILAQSGTGPPTGPTSGLMSADGTSISNTSDPLIVAPGCWFVKNSSYVRKDIRSIPSNDIFGNAIDTNYKYIDTYPSGPYQGEMRVDTPAAVQAASYNAADSAAKTMRNDTTYSPVIYSIGFSGGVDPQFLRRVSNDPQSSTYISTRPAGLYVYAPNESQLSSAFNRVASEILRLAK